MSEWNHAYQDEIQTLEFIFQRLLMTWDDIEYDFEKERPNSLDRLNEATDEFVEALVDFRNEVDLINERDKA